uniref:CSON008998 protein n=1 Tax=Culicoides sonorensis TaxID=179676 RepID=A0A336LDY3_CULSO
MLSSNIRQFQHNRNGVKLVVLQYNICSVVFQENFKFVIMVRDIMTITHPEKKSLIVELTQNQ